MAVVVVVVVVVVVGLCVCVFLQVVGVEFEFVSRFCRLLQVLLGLLGVRVFEELVVIL